MADIYVAKSKDEGWKVWNDASNSWHTASLQDLLNATMTLNESTGAYVPVDFKSAYNKGDRSGPIEWNAVKNTWVIKYGESLKPVAGNPADSESKKTATELRVLDENAVEDLLQRISRIVEGSPDYKAELKSFLKDLRGSVFDNLREESQSAAYDLTQALQASYQKLDDGVEEILEKVSEVEIPTLDYKKELRIFRESLEETVKKALREELRPLVEKELRQEIRAFKSEEIEKDIIKAQLIEELTPVVRAELAYELRQMPVALEERPQLSKSEQEIILNEARARLIASVSLNGIEIRDAKARLAREVKLSEWDVEEQKRLLRSQVEFKEKAELELIRQQVLEQDGYESLSAFRKSTVNDQRDAVIKELRRAIRPIIEGSLRNELTLPLLRELAADTTNGVLSDSAKQVEYSLRKQMEDEVRKQELQNALFHVREILEKMDLNETIKLEIILRIEQETRISFLSPKAKVGPQHQSDGEVILEDLLHRNPNKLGLGFVSSEGSAVDDSDDEQFEQI